jgi:hypothetical protein
MQIRQRRGTILGRWSLISIGSIGYEPRHQLNVRVLNPPSKGTEYKDLWELRDQGESPTHALVTLFYKLWPGKLQYLLHYYDRNNYS